MECLKLSLEMACLRRSCVLQWQTLFAYIAAAIPAGAQQPVSLTIDASRSAFELLAKVIQRPPIMVSVRMTDEQTHEVGPYGELYTALWPVASAGSTVA